MAVVIYYVDKFYKVRTRLIALRYLHGGHDGENQVILLMEIIKKYGLKNLFGYFVSDNAISCDTAIDAILYTLFLVLSAALRSERRLRYYDHVINLAVRAFLWGKNNNSFELNFNTHTLVQAEEAELTE